ncbi:MAG: DUF881 domain-containing protein [Firmicutes bacterium]|nr:DUF881 domain-containing protein [Bacillota bacterium]
MTTLAYRRTAPNDKPVKWRKVRRRRVVRMGELDWFALLLLASIVLLFDALVIGRHVGIIRLPGELSVLDMARLGAMSYVDMQRTMLERDEFAGVGSADPVLRDAAEGLTNARSTEETGRELAKASTKLYEAVQADRLYAARGRVLELLSLDGKVQSYAGQDAYILITPGTSGSQVQDRQNVLEKSTRTAIAADPLIAKSPTAIEVVIDLSGVSFDTGDLATQADVLAREIDSLHEQGAELRRAAGLSELEGAGVIVLAYDAPSGYGFEEIVHQRDVSEILDRLFAAGAIGAQVGGERVIATSSIRCIGPIVLVNQRPVAVNPIRIYAVGNPYSLERALQPMVSEFAKTDKRLEIKHESSLFLAAYHKGGLQW